MCRSKAHGGRRCRGGRIGSAAAMMTATLPLEHTGRAASRGTGPAVAAAVMASPGPAAETAGGDVPPVPPPVLPSGHPGGYGALTGDERTRAILADLETAVAAIAASGKVEQWLDAMSSDGLNRWSANNRILALTQLHQKATQQDRPELLDQVHMMTFKQWRDRFGRTVNKGETAMYILRPRTRTIVDEDDAGETTRRVITTGFSPVAVFNVTQTAGPAVPAPPVTPATGDLAPGVLDGLRSRVGAAGYTYREEPIGGCDPAKGTGTLGYTTTGGKDRQIVVDSRLSDMQKASTIAHELAHVHCGHVEASPGEYRQHRGQMETEAEAAAYLTCRRLGVTRGQSQAFSPGYIAGWLAQHPQASFQVALNRAVKASDTITEGDWPDLRQSQERQA